MTIKLYDLAGEDAALRFSPFCWRTKMALKHKGLPFETEAWHITEKEAIADSGQSVWLKVHRERCTETLEGRRCSTTGSTNESARSRTCMRNPRWFARRPASTARSWRAGGRGAACRNRR